MYVCIYVRGTANFSATPRRGPASSANGFRFLTAFTAACNGTCGAAPGTSPYLALAVANCSEGSLDSALDYRPGRIFPLAFRA